MMLLAAISLLTQAQDLRIESFELSGQEIISSSDQRIDMNGTACALVKVQLLDDIDHVEGNVIGNVIDRGAEKWVFLTSGTKEFRIFPKKHLPLIISCRDFDIPGLESKRVYILRLKVINESSPSVMFGVRGGANLAWTQFEEGESVSMATSFYLGVSLDIPFSEMFYVNPSLIFSNKGYKCGDEKGSAQYIDLPVLASLRFGDIDEFQFHINAGPYVAFGVGGNIEGPDNQEVKFFDYYNSFDYGLAVGVGALISRHFYINATAQIGFADYRNRNIGIGIGYNF